jgi:hypothetical protein
MRNQDQTLSSLPETTRNTATFAGSNQVRLRRGYQNQEKPFGWQRQR